MWLQRGFMPVSRIRSRLTKFNRASKYFPKHLILTLKLSTLLDLRSYVTLGRQLPK